MGEIFVHVSKFILLVLMFLYVIEAFQLINENNHMLFQKRIKKQRYYLFIFHFWAHLTLFVANHQIRFWLFYALETVIFVIYLVMYDYGYKKNSKPLLNNVCMFVVVGLIMLERLNPNMAYKQLIFLSAAVVVAGILPLMLMKIPKLKQYTWLYALLGLLLLSVVLAIATVSHGAKLSLSLGPISIQPSEFVKILYVFFLSSILCKKNTFKNIAITTLIAAAHVVILVASRDLGAAFIFFVTYMVLVYVSTKDLRYFAAIACAGVASSILAYQLFSHVRVRVLAWQDPFAVIDGAGYQVSQSLFAIGTGGWFGSGLFQGLPQSIPVVEKDFIFSAISEEMGLFLAILLIVLCIICIMLIFNIAIWMKHTFYKFVALGIAVIYATQVFLTIGGATRLIPSTGVTFPFVSYGGSSLLSTFIMFSIVQGIYIIKENEGEQIAQKRKEKYEQRKKKKQYKV